MAIVKVHHATEYTVVSNSVLRDNRLHLKTIGLLVKILGLPENWDFSEAGLAAICLDGLTAVRSCLTEMEQYGYLKRTMIRDKGKVVDVQYDIYENPNDNLKSEELILENLISENKYNKINNKYNTQINKINNISEVKEIVDYLNSRTNSKYKYSSDSTKRHIEARLNEGFTVEDCKHVIDVKYADWYGTDYEKYLRPETLFGSKFQNYLNQKLTAQQSVISKRYNPEDSSGVIF